MTLKQSPAARVLSTWTRLSKKPAGKWLFGRIVARAIPYTGSVHPDVQEVRSGYARVLLHDRRRVRNHLNSIHAIALTNVGEFTGGLAMTATLPVSCAVVTRPLTLTSAISVSLLSKLVVRVTSSDDPSL